MKGFDVTYEIVTPESAEAGDFEETGYAGEGLQLREAIACLHETRTSKADAGGWIEPDSWPISLAYPPSSFRLVYGIEYLTGARESRTLHLPRGCTPSSAMRIARLLEV